MKARPALYVALGLLMAVSIIELSFISATVGFLHDTASGYFAFQYRGEREELYGHPKNLLTDQGHTSNGASGTAFILIGIGGFLVLWLRSRPAPNKFTLFLYHAWLVFNVLSLFLTLASLIYVFVVTNNHKGQRIDPSVAARLDGKPYNLDTWTPQGWFTAVLQLNLSDSDVRHDIQSRLRVMRGWQWNLIPFFIIHFFETGLALWDAVQRRKEPTPSKMPESWKKSSV
ncbi:hypothetical protein ACJ41O_010277 [Fusarium nematophilum]